MEHGGNTMYRPIFVIALLTLSIAALKAEKLRIPQWRDKESTRDAVRVAILNFLYDDRTGLPVERYTENEVNTKVDVVFTHVFRIYPTVPSPYYQSTAG
jgi:type I restriction enzyme, R subunit